MVGMMARAQRGVGRGLVRGVTGTWLGRVLARRRVRGATMLELFGWFALAGGITVGVAAAIYFGRNGLIGWQLGRNMDLLVATVNDHVQSRGSGKGFSIATSKDLFPESLRDADNDWLLFRGKYRVSGCAGDQVIDVPNGGICSDHAGTVDNSGPNLVGGDDDEKGTDRYVYLAFWSDESDDLDDHLCRALARIDHDAVHTVPGNTGGDLYISSDTNGANKAANYFFGHGTTSDGTGGTAIGEFATRGQCEFGAVIGATGSEPVMAVIAFDTSKF